MDQLNNNLLEALNRCRTWIHHRSRLAEFNESLAEELEQQLILEVIESNKSFIKLKIDSPDAWVKKIVTNVIATYVRNQVVHGKLNQKYADQQYMSTNEQVRPEDQTEVQIVLKFMRDHFSLRDQEIMHLYISKEDHKSIAEIIGMTPGSVANTISKLKQEIDDFLNRGHYVQ
jgi:RNA polymerase sigma factor (sigma-70 family)